MDSVRERVVQYLVDMFTGMKKGEPVADPYNYTWSIVSRDNIGQLARGKLCALGIYDTEEQKVERMNYVLDCTLRVIIEVHMYVSHDEEASKLLNTAISDIERRLMEDQTFGGLIFNVSTVGVEKHIDSQYDKQVSGALFVELKYRHLNGDPRQRR